MIKAKQLSLADIYSECNSVFENDKYHFLSLLEENINLEELIPTSFYNHFYSSFGRKRVYPLSGFLWALLL